MSEEIIKFPNLNAALAPEVEELEGVEIAPVMAPTMSLRFSGDVLQQLFQNVHGPETEWRDMPTAD
jgi:hypothetical protein